MLAEVVRACKYYFRNLNAAGNAAIEEKKCLGVTVELNRRLAKTIRRFRQGLSQPIVGQLPKSSALRTSL